MLLSRERGFAFIHIPKTAGMSVHRALAEVSPDAVRRIEEMPATHDRQKQRHAFAQDLKRHLGEPAWQRLFTFAFVRNPWARMVSWYNMCRERPTTPFMWRVSREVASFAEFIELPDNFLERTRFNQIDYVTDDDGQILVNFVGRYESLNRDFDWICKHIGVEVTLPHVNSTTRVDYREYYNPRSRRLVTERFRRDIDAFGYDFDAPPE